MPNRIAEPRAKIRATKRVEFWGPGTGAPTILAPVLTDAECDALMRQLVLDAERAIIADIRSDANETWLESVLRIEQQHRGDKSVLLDNPGDPDGK